MARDAVQADRLEAVLSGAVAPEDVPGDLARLASLADSLRDEIEVEAPSDMFRARLRTQVLTADPVPSLLTRLQDRFAEGTARVRHSLRVAGATAMASTMIGTAGVAAAAQEALPGDLLYGIKGATEDARMLFASDGLERGRLHLAFARERLEEVELGIDRLSGPELESALTAFDQQAAAGANLLLAEPTSPQVQGELTAFTAEVRRRLSAVMPQLPLSVRPATETSLEVLRRIDLQLRGLVDASTCPGCAGEAVLPRIVLPGEGPADGASCDCAGATGPGATADRRDDDPAPTEPTRPDPSLGGRLDSPTPTPDEPSGRSGGVSSTVRDTGSIVDDVLDGTGDTVRDVASEVGDTVGDVGGDVGGTVGDVASELGGTVGDVASELGDTAGEVTDGLGDTVGEVRSELSDATGDPGDTTGDVTDGLGGLLGGD